MTQSPSLWNRFSRWLVSRWKRRPLPGGIRITRIGLWYVLFTMLVAAAATNTGNNALYLVLAFQLALLVVSGWTSRRNVEGLEVELEVRGEVYAFEPAPVQFRIHNRSRWSLKRLLLVALQPGSAVNLVPVLPPGGIATGTFPWIFARRGRARFEEVWVQSLFPLGLFRKGMRYPVACDVLVYPQLFDTARWGGADVVADEGSSPGARRGWGHELFALREFRSGDDPRGIHWKKSAQVGSLVVRERESEDQEHLTVVLDNATGPLDEERRKQFERLISEAATVAVSQLQEGCSVGLITRSGEVKAGTGGAQRRAILEHLALLEPVARTQEPILPRHRVGTLLHLELETKGKAA